MWHNGFWIRAEVIHEAWSIGGSSSCTCSLAVGSPEKDQRASYATALVGSPDTAITFSARSEARPAPAFPRHQLASGLAAAKMVSMSDRQVDRVDWRISFPLSPNLLISEESSDPNGFSVPQPRASSNSFYPWVMGESITCRPWSPARPPAVPSRDTACTFAIGFKESWAVTVL